MKQVAICWNDFFLLLQSDPIGFFSDQLGVECQLLAMLSNNQKDALRNFPCCED